MNPTVCRALLCTSLLFAIHCGGGVVGDGTPGDNGGSNGSTGDDGNNGGANGNGGSRADGACVEPVLNAPCVDPTYFCATPETPATGCTEPCAPGQCFLAKGWGCEEGVASFSGALICRTPGTTSTGDAPDAGVDAGDTTSSGIGISPPADRSQTVLLYVPGDYASSKSTWTWNGHTWVDVEPTHRPSQRDGAVMASDGTEVILFGGYGSPDNNTLADTWAWANGDWKQLSPKTSPPARSFAALGKLGERLVLFGGSPPNSSAPFALLADTWTWDGKTWSEAHPSVSPPGRFGAAFAPLGDGKLLLFGGDDEDQEPLSDTWLWDGARWSQVTTPASPGGSFAQAVAAIGGTVYAVASNYEATDTWTFTGSTWKATPTSKSLDVAIDNWGMASYGDTVLLYGGYADGNQDPVQDRTYAWDGSSWSDLGASPGPAKYANGAAPCILATFP